MYLKLWGAVFCDFILFDQSKCHRISKFYAVKIVAKLSNSTVLGTTAGYIFCKNTFLIKWMQCIKP